MSETALKADGPPITPAGMAALRARYDHLLGKERPEIVEIVARIVSERPGGPENA